MWADLDAVRDPESGELLHRVAEADRGSHVLDPVPGAIDLAGFRKAPGDIGNQVDLWRTVLEAFRDSLQLSQCRPHQRRVKAL